MQLYWSAPSLYVRTPFDGTSDKVTRIFVSPTPSATSNGVVDFVAERLIPTSTAPAGIVSAFGSGFSLRGGLDESPPARINGAIIGGNHKIGGLNTVAGRTVELSAGGAPLVLLPGAATVPALEIVESYSVFNPGVTGAPLLADVDIRWTIGEDGLVRVAYQLQALQDIAVDWVNGIQSQRPSTADGSTLTLFVPGSAAAGGTALPAADFLRLPASTWADGAPAMFIEQVSGGTGPGRFFVSGFTDAPTRDSLSTAVEISPAGKLYPRGFEGPLAAGQEVALAGYFGTLPAAGGHWNVTPTAGPFVAHRVSVSDSAGRPWAQIDRDYDLAGQMAVERRAYDDGMVINTLFDRADVQPWQTSSARYAPGGAMDYLDTVYDDGTRTLTDQDQAGVMPWTTKTTAFAAGGQIASVRVDWDSGSFGITATDTANAQPWQMRIDSYTAAGLRDFVNYYQDDGTRKTFDFDQDASQPWDTKDVRYNAAGRAVSISTSYDDGSRIRKEYDPENVNTTREAIVRYDDQARADWISTLYDDGSRIVKDFDQADAFPWIEHVTVIGVDGRTISDGYSF